MSASQIADLTEKFKRQAAVAPRGIIPASSWSIGDPHSSGTYAGGMITVTNSAPVTTYTSTQLGV